MWLSPGESPDEVSDWTAADDDDVVVWACVLPGLLSCVELELELEVVPVSEDEEEEDEEDDSPVVVVLEVLLVFVLWTVDDEV